MNKKIVYIAIFMAVIFSLFACGAETNDTTAGLGDLPDVTEPSGGGASEHTHSYAEKIIEPTCTKLGQRALVCSCGDIQSTLEYLPMKEHTGNPASCGVDSVCSVCGELLVEKYEHIFVYTTVTELTCTTDGVVKSTCHRCGFSENIVTKASHSYPIYELSGGKLSAKCEVCGEVASDIKFTNLHSKATCGISADSFTAISQKYNLPTDVIGTNKAPYQIDFKFTLNSIVNPANLYNNNNGRNICQYVITNGYNSLVRIFPVSDGAGGYLSDVVEIGTLDEINVSSTKYLKMREGDSIKISLAVDPETESVDIYVNGVYASTRDKESVGMKASSTQIAFGYGQTNAVKATVSDFAMFRAEIG